MNTASSEVQPFHLVAPGGALRNPSIAVGETEIIALVDAVPDPVDASWSFPDVPARAWTAHAGGSLDEAGRFRPNLACFAVRMPGSTVLIDFGIGPGPNAYLKEIRGRLPERLAAAGLSFGDIGSVVFTHLHMDHVGWATTRDADGVAHASCPGARHYVAERELSFWQQAPTSVGAHHREAFEDRIVPLVRDGLIQTVRGKAEFAPGLSLLATPGHTPGHSSVMIRSADHVIVVAGDVFHCPAQVERPDWCHRADHDPAGARASRNRFLAEAAEGGWLIAAGHFRDGWMFGRVARGRDGYRFVPVRTA
jgi:glyoxylase-like metal-dependent hydrolase (beta-lactamase superfamily II)